MVTAVALKRMARACSRRTHGRCVSRFMDDMRPTLGNRIGTFGVVLATSRPPTGTLGARFGPENGSCGTPPVVAGGV